MVQALAAQAAYQPLTDGVRAWRANGRSDQSDPGARRDLVEMRTVFRIIVTDEILRRLAKRPRLSQLRGDPVIRWRAGDATCTMRREPSSVMKNANNGRNKASWSCK